MRKLFYWFIICLFSISTNAQNHELLYWTGQNTATYSYPQPGSGLAAEISSANQDYNGLITFSDNRNVWNNPNSAPTVDPLTAPYLSFVLNLNSNISFDRFVVHGAAPTTPGIKMQLRWSEDSFASSLGEFTPGSSSYNLTSVDLSSIGNVTGPTVEFRIYYYAVSGYVFHSDTGPYTTTDGTPSFYTSYGRCFSIWGDEFCTPKLSTDVQTSCDSFSWINGNTYTFNNDTATYTITDGASNGCDSIITLDLTIINSATGTDIQTACDSFVWMDANTYTSSNNTATYTIAGGAFNGCDSVITLDLIIINSATSTDIQTACDSFTWIDGNTYTSSNNTATYTIAGGASNGCDSIVSLDLTILNSTTGTDTRTECNFHTWIDGVTYTSTNNTAKFNIVGGAANGCDSLVHLDLTIYYHTNGTEVTTTCDSFTWIDGNTYTSSNNTATYTIAGGASNGCDSMITLDLTIKNTATGTDTRTACDSFTWIDGNTYASSNNTATYTIAGGASNGCDSIVTLDLTIINTATGTDTRTECDSFTWIDGNTYTSSNNTATYTIAGGAFNGCDSMITLDLTIINTATGTDTRTACDSFTWIDGNTYASSNNTATYTIAGGAFNGCDSMVTLDLTIINTATGTDTRTACDSFTWIDGNTYASSNNTATYTIAGGASNGCDSIVTLDLTIINTATGTDTRTECDSFTWIDGNTYISSNNTATYTIAGGASNGCDSIVTLDLTIINTATGTDTRTACDSFTWIDGNTYASSNNTATYTIAGGASNGCDSIVTLDLTINKVDTGITSNGTTITSNATGASYQWLDCDNSFSEVSGATNQFYTAVINGNYAVEVSKNGCTDTSACISITTVGIIENSMNDNFVVFPNPTKGNIIIEFEDNQSFVQMKLMSINGQLLKSETVINSSVFELEIENSPGIYLIELIGENKTKAVLRIVKE